MNEAGTVSSTAAGVRGKPAVAVTLQAVIRLRVKQLSLLLN